MKYLIIVLLCLPLVGCKSSEESPETLKRVAYQYYFNGCLESGKNPAQDLKACEEKALKNFTVPTSNIQILARANYLEGCLSIVPTLKLEPGTDGSPIVAEYLKAKLNCSRKSDSI